MPRDPIKRRLYMRRYIAEWRERNPGRRWSGQRSPEQHRAQEAVRRAVQSGKLVRPEECERCGDPGPIEASHDDYERRLEVEWLCRPCHRLKDKP